MKPDTHISKNVVASTICLVFSILFCTLSYGQYGVDYDPVKHNATIDSNATPDEVLPSLLENARFFILQGQQEQALQALSKAYDMAMESNNRKLIASTLTEIANLYYESSQYESAARYYGEALSYNEDDPHLSATIMFNLGHISAAQGRYEQANEEFLQSLSLSRSISDTYGQAFTLKALGVNSQALEMPGVARNYFFNALEIFINSGNMAQATHVRRHLADIALMEENFSEAVNGYVHTIGEYLKVEDFTGLMRSYRGLSTALENEKEFEEALNAHKTYAEIALYLAGEQGKDATRRFQVAFDTQHYADNNEKLLTQNRSQQATLDYQTSLLTKQRLINILAVCVVMLIGALLLRSRRFSKEMQLIASTDELTGILNRRAILRHGDIEFKRAKRFERKISCLMIDIDHFKSINDTWGHDAGDKVLKKVARTIASSLRVSDYFGRIGGEEFLLIAPETNPIQAMHLAKRICHNISNLKFDEIGDRSVTISVGMVQKNEQESLEELITQADRALYTAKASGRNQVVKFEHLADMLN